MLGHALFTTTTTTLITLATASCPRAELFEAVSAFLSAQSTGDPSLLVPYLSVSAWNGFFENNQPVSLNASTLSTALPLSHTRTLYDTAACATFTELVSNSSTNPHVIGTQLRFDLAESSVDSSSRSPSRITLIDSIVTKPGDWLFNASGYAYWTAREDWSPIAADARDTRGTLQAAADAYCSVFNDVSVSVPWGTPCVRLEGGLYGDAGPNGTCAVGIPSGVPLRRRRYVVDEELGAVDVLVDFGNSGWPDSHLFRVEKGRLRYVHTLTHCGVPNCGVN